MDNCKVEDCGKPVYADGLCRIHSWLENEKTYLEGKPRLSTNPLSYREVGRSIGVSKERVRQITKALEKERSFGNEEARKHILENYKKGAVRASLGLETSYLPKPKQIRIPDKNLINLEVGQAVFFPSNNFVRLRNRKMRSLPQGEFRSVLDREAEGVWVLRVKEPKVLEDPE